MGKIAIALVVSLLFGTSSVCQVVTLSHQSINQGGGSAASIDYSLGQVAIMTLSSGQGDLTQGFQQPETGVGTAVTSVSVQSANYSPNPTLGRGTLSLEMNVATGGYVTVTTSTGQIVTRESFDKTQSLSHSIDMEQRSTGVYLIQVYSDRGELLFVNRIVKI